MRKPTRLRGSSVKRLRGGDIRLARRAVSSTNDPCYRRRRRWHGFNDPSHWSRGYGCDHPGNNSNNSNDVNDDDDDLSPDCNFIEMVSFATGVDLDVLTLAARSK